MLTLNYFLSIGCIKIFLNYWTYFACHLKLYTSFEYRMYSVYVYKHIILRCLGNSVILYSNIYKFNL